MNHATPSPLLRRLGWDRRRRQVALDAADFGTEFGMEMYLSQRSLAAQRDGTRPTHWFRRLVRRVSGR